jgi:hypothetical protein
MAVQVPYDEKVLLTKIAEGDTAAFRILYDEQRIAFIPFPFNCFTGKN